MRKRLDVVNAAAVLTALGISSMALGVQPDKIVQSKSLNTPERAWNQAMLNGAGYNLEGFAGGGTEASGTWVGPATFFGDPSNFPRNNTFGFWNTASNWSGGVPNGATDAATFNNLGDLAGVTAILDNGNNITLQTFNDNTEEGVDVVVFRSGTATFTTGSGGLTVNKNVKTFNLSPTTSRFLTFGEAFGLSVAGSGALVKNGPGDNWLVRNNSMAGGITVNNGRLNIAGSVVLTTDQPIGAYGDSVLGANGATLTLNGGVLGVISQDPGSGDLQLNRPVVIGPNGGEFGSQGLNGGNTNPRPVFNQPISGTGLLRMGDGSDAVIESDCDNFTGTIVLDDYVFLGLGESTGVGSMRNAASWVNFGRLDVFNIVGNDSNRFGDNAAHRLFGGEINYTDTALGDVTENIGQLVMEGGTNTISIVTNGGNLASITANGVTRNDGGVMFLRGRNFGATTGGRGLLLLDSAPAQIGGVVPWAYGATSTSTASNLTTALGTARPATYDAVRGLRPLSDGEMTAGIGAGGNALVNASSGTGGTVNSLTLSGSGLNLTGNITVSSGLVLDAFDAAAASGTAGNTISGNLGFGSQEAIFITVPFEDRDPASASTPLAGQGLTVAGTITTTGGLTKGGFGDLILGGSNSISGPITLGMGRTILTNDNALGTSGDAIKIVSATYTPEFFATTASMLMNGKAAGATLTINKNINVEGETASPQGATIGNLDAGGYTRVNGNVSLATPEFNFTGLTVRNGTVDFAGVISGGGMLLDDGATGTASINYGQGVAGGTGLFLTTGTTAVILRSANTFTGGIESGFFRAGVRPTRWILGNDAGFGTGPFTVTSAAVIESLDSTQRNIANDFLCIDGLNFAGTGAIRLTGTVDLNINQGRQSWRVPTSLPFVELAGVIKNGGIFKRGDGLMVISGDGSGINGILSVGNPGSATANTERGGILEIRSATGFGGGGLSNTGFNLTQVVTGGTVRLNTGATPTNNSEDFFFNGAGFNGEGAINNVSGNNRVGDLHLNAYLIGAGSLVRNAGVATIAVAAGSTLSANDYYDESGPLSISPQAATITIRGNGAGVLTKVGAGVLEMDRVWNTSSDIGTMSVFNSAAFYGYTNVTKAVATGGFNIRAGTLRITQGASNNLTEKVTKVQSVTIASAQEASAGKLDLTNNGMIIDYTGATPLAGYEALIAEGRNGGNWAGNGITSSTAAAGGPAFLFALGIAEVSETDLAVAGQFLGVPIDSDAVLIRYTRAGDLNLDGSVDFDDFALFGPGFGGPARWASGDFTYDGIKDLGDFALIAANFNQTAGDLPRGFASSTVPEPTAVGLIGLAVGGLAARRRRH